jgi:hypothetical protein
VSTNDGSRVEAAEAGVHAEQGERAAHGHVDAPEAVSGAHHAPSHGVGHDDDHGSHGGHGADPNAGVLRGEAPTPAWVWTAALIGLVTIGFCFWLAVKIG